MKQQVSTCLCYGVSERAGIEPRYDRTFEYGRARILLRDARFMQRTNYYVGLTHREDNHVNLQLGF